MVVLSVQYLLRSVGVYGFVFWLPTIVKAGAGVGIAATGLLSAVPYALAVVLMLVASHGSDTTGRRRVFVWPFLLVAALALAGSYLLGAGHFWPSFALLVLAGGCIYAPVRSLLRADSRTGAAERRGRHATSAETGVGRGHGGCRGVPILSRTRQVMRIGSGKASG